MLFFQVLLNPNIDVKMLKNLHYCNVLNNFATTINVNMNFNEKQVLFIDLDNTLINTVSGKTFPVDVTDFKIRKEVLDKIVDAFPNLYYIEIVSNQGGIPQFVDEADFKGKIRTIEGFVQNYMRNHTQRNVFVVSQYCTSESDENMRKPNVGMLLSYSSWNKSKLMMIGDASGKEGDFSDSDKKCASNFGIDYIDVEDFLNL